MANKSIKSTGLGADAFFSVPTSKPQTAPTVAAKQNAHQDTTPTQTSDKAERRSFNLKLSILRQLDEVQIKTMRDGNKWTLSAIVERGIELVAKEMGVSDDTSKRAGESKNK